MTVEPLPSRYRLLARYSGDAVRHDVVVRFELGSPMYVVTAELFEDGNGVAIVSDPSRPDDDAPLDPPQVVSPGLVDLSVRNEQIARISGMRFSVSVSLKVDGSEIETCEPR